VSPQNVAQVIAVTGWCAGMIVILACQLLAVALAMLAATAGTAVAVAVAAGPRRAWTRLTALVKRPRRQPETGGSVERA
jgi:hypothetical protein